MCVRGILHVSLQTMSWCHICDFTLACRLLGLESVILAWQYLLTLSHKSVSGIVRTSHCSTDRLLDPVLDSGSDLQELFKIFFCWSQFCWSGCCAVPIFNTKTKTWHSNSGGYTFYITCRVCWRIGSCKSSGHEPRNEALIFRRDCSELLAPRAGFQSHFR